MSDVDRLVAHCVEAADLLASDLTGIPDWWDELGQIERLVREQAAESDLAEVSPKLAALVAEMTIETLRAAARIPRRRTLN